MPKIDNPRDVLLLVLNGIGRPCGRMHLVKLLYLFGEEELPKLKLRVDRYYVFSHTVHGPFSERVYDDLQFLEHGCDLVRKTSADDAISEEADEWLDWIGNFSHTGQVQAFAEFAAERFALTEKGRAFVKRRLLPALGAGQKRRLDRFCSRLGATPLRALLEYLRDNYPAEIRHRAVNAPRVVA